jgi:hypothetical protein
VGWHDSFFLENRWRALIQAFWVEKWLPNAASKAANPLPGLKFAV